MSQLFEVTTRPNADLFFKKQDVNDPRLGETVLSAPDDYPTADIVILGCPQDEGVKRNGGRMGAADAPDEIRRCFYKLTVNGLEQLKLFDLGNTIIQSTLEETHALQQQIVRQIISDGKTLIVLGGGNDISYPDCSGLAQAVGEVLTFNVDSHFDVRADTVRNSGTPYRQLLEEGFIKPDHFYEMGFQPFANSPIYHRYIEDIGAHGESLQHLRSGGVIQTFTGILEYAKPTTIFWGLDLDVVTAADAPGVSAPNPGGLTGDELFHIATLAGKQPQSRLLEISEVNPQYDIDQRTCRLAAIVMYAFLSAR
ncbi:MAG: arginase [Anaerolineaceae bacterium]|nr:arginase [Anaerolineaceae bacterium]